MDFINSLFGGGGQQGGPGALGTAFIPPFVDQGGITPEQGALADFTGGEGLVGIANEFGASGTGASTMETQGAGGINFGEAQQKGQMSDIDTEAQYQLYQNDVQTQLTELGKLAQQEQANNTQAGVNAGQLGQLVGQSGNLSNLFGGGSQGSFTGTS
jgi:hypothetical protein